MERPEFKPFPSIARLHRDCAITEKIDGTNAVICITEDGSVHAGSRSRWITPEDDNQGFAAWVAAHEEELRALGVGCHYGEWWGAGIQRRYGLDHKRFSLFNVRRWCASDAEPLGFQGQDPRQPPVFQMRAPACCHVVPTLYRGPFDTGAIHQVSEALRELGSKASPGFMNPEGIVVFHEASQSLFKFTIDGDGHKGAKKKRGAA